MSNPNCERPCLTKQSRSETETFAGTSINEYLP